jgi:acetolactate synthase I/II/III large subunit
MNGAQSLLHTLAGAGVEVCFANPGTSEMHFLAALEDVEQVRGVLGLAEGVVTGAADGYGRMAGRPAATLLHLGPGMANGLANLHNARRAFTPLVNVVGDHALDHKGFDAPLESDIDAAAGTVSDWVRRSKDSASVGADAAEAVAAASSPPGQVATLVLPADVSWSDGGQVAPPVVAAEPRRGACRDRRGGRRGGGLGRGDGAAGRCGLPGARAAGSQPYRRGHRRPGAGRDLPGPPRARGGPAQLPPARLPR